MTGKRYHVLFINCAKGWYLCLTCLKKATLSFVKGSFNLHSNAGVTYRPTLRINSFTHMSNKTRLLETIFSFSKTIPAYLQYGKELFAGWSCHTHLTGLPGPDQSLVSHPWDILGRPIHDSIPSQLPHFPNLNTSWLNNGNASLEGVGVRLKASLSMRKSLVECIHKGDGHTMYKI